MTINPLSPSDITPPQASGLQPALAGDGGVSFKDLLSDALKQVNQLQQNADTAATQLAAGGPVAIDEVVLAMQKADLALQLTMQIRNKLVDAYQEVARMQI
jgi:flagellar hook-basal body complex protein FliE